jgi:hypothetical protein
MLFENTVLRKVFGLDSGEVTGDWRKLHNEELCHLCCSPNIREIKSRRIGWVGNVACMEEKEMHAGFDWEFAGKRPLGTPRNRWEDNIKVDIKETEKVDMD